MNSIWNKNISLFKNRFPSLFEIFFKEIENFCTDFEKNSVSFWGISFSKNNLVTASEKSFNQKLHSFYNPQKEAENLALTAKNSENLIFESFGLGYLVVECAKKFPQKSFVVLEPDLNHFLAAMVFLDWSAVFEIKNLILALSCTPEQAITLINQFSMEESSIFCVKSQISHAQDYYSVLNELIERNKNQQKINNSTLEKFGPLWIKNSIKNLRTVFFANSILPYKNEGKNLPFVVIAAGPTLEEILPFLAEIKNRAVLVAVDTALKACLTVNVEPDFIILTDPQYWAYMHIAGLSSKSSILITEASVLPCVFRFDCKKILACTSNFFLEQYFEQISFSKGTLISGGSVASTAWNFCEFCGAKEIFTAGLDLSFPDKKTHIKGSQFEEKIHTSSTKIKSAQTQSLPLLFSANCEYAENFQNQKVLTDKRMKMFAWWFESRIQNVCGVKTFSFSKKGLKIPGIENAEIKDFLSEKPILAQKEDFINLYKNENLNLSEKDFYNYLNIFTENLRKILNESQKVLNVLNDFKNSPLGEQKFFDAEQNFNAECQKLKISSFVKVLFPTKNQQTQTEFLLKKFEKYSLLSQNILKILQKISKLY